ncbi:hypothetical protein OIU19_18660 [Pseudomonas sp. BT-42-2]|uniref:hypothetical protein n=1 Tax=Pseudomonas sp. BT-42-2 TaxID=2986927 RepID=UPI0021F7F950|nr:hypothetical protein [Pseudomonas sp. BT-42-2]MCV9920811.1 hypothetical protein [Pseudomonas sp. BT-42-2]
MSAVREKEASASFFMGCQFLGLAWAEALPSSSASFALVAIRAKFIDCGIAASNPVVSPEDVIHSLPQMHQRPLRKTSEYANAKDMSQQGRVFH